MRTNCSDIPTVDEAEQIVRQLEKYRDDERKSQLLNTWLDDVNRQLRIRGVNHGETVVFCIDSCIWHDSGLHQQAMRELIDCLQWDGWEGVCVELIAGKRSWLQKVFCFPATERCTLRVQVRRPPSELS
jgi:hypothetical protein